jgi:hypothetical protein
MGVAGGVDTTGALGVRGTLEAAVVPAEDVIARRQRLIRWLSRRCLYCFVYCAITKVQPSAREHWHEDCPRSGSIPADPRVRPCGGLPD